MSKKNTDFTSLLYQSVFSVSGLFSAGITPLLFVMFEGSDMFDMLADMGGISGANEKPATYTLKKFEALLCSRTYSEKQVLRSFRLVPGHPTAEHFVSSSILYCELKEGKETKIGFLLFRLHGGQVESFLGLQVGSGVGRNVYGECLLGSGIGVKFCWDCLLGEWGRVECLLGLFVGEWGRVESLLGFQWGRVERLLGLFVGEWGKVELESAGTVCLGVGQGGGRLWSAFNSLLHTRRQNFA